jgi:hypothetical protein
MSTRGCAPSCTRVQRDMRCTRVTSASRTVELALVYRTLVCGSELEISDCTAYMLVLGIDYLDYRPQCVAHAHQVRDLCSMVSRGAHVRAL